MDWNELLKQAVSSRLVDRSSDLTIVELLEKWSQLLNNSCTMTKQEMAIALQELEDMRNGTR